jgi:hypothetical protein
MTKHSPRYRWQTRWTIDAAEHQARHESGLIVEFDRAPGLPLPHGRASNGPAIEAALAEKHGHNAPAMVQRMVREARQLYGGHNA